MTKDRPEQTSDGLRFLIKGFRGINLKFRLHQDDHWRIKHSWQMFINDRAHNVPHFSRWYSVLGSTCIAIRLAS